MPLERVRFSGVIASAGLGRVMLQRKMGAAWETVDQARTGPRGRYALTVRMADDRRPRTFRVKWQSAAAGVHTTPSSIRTSVRMTPNRYRYINGEAVYAGGSSQVGVVPSSFRTGRRAWLELWDGDSWQRTGASTTSVADGPAFLTYNPVHWPQWYRVTAEPWKGAPAVSTPSRLTKMTAVPIVCAHRGGSGRAPENTLAAVGAALQDQVSMIEGDARLTRDGQLVMMHDPTLGRTTNIEDVFPGRVSASVEDFTLDELRQLDAGSWFSPRFAAERVPTLAEWLRAVGESAQVSLEIKDPWRSPVAVAAALQGVLDDPSVSSGVRDRLTVSAGDANWTRDLGGRIPGIKLGYLAGEALSPASITSAATWADSLIIALSEVDADQLQAARAGGMSIQVWTVNGIADAQRAVALGADVIITDSPATVGSVLSPPKPSS